MALLLTEGFDWTTNISHLQSSGGYAKWASIAASLSTATLSSSGGRNGNGLRFTTTATSSTINLAFNFPAGETGFCYMGFAFRVSALPTGNAVSLGYFGNGGTPAIMVKLTSAGALRFTPASSTFFLPDTGYSGPTIAVNTWYYVELKAKYSASSATGDNQLRVNGTLANAVNSGQNVRGDASGSMSSSGLGYPNSSGSMASAVTIDFDDVYILNASGSFNNTFLGDCKVETLFPTADSATNSTWTPTPSGAGTNWQRVKEVPPDGDTTYVSTATVGNRDGYTFGPLSSVPASIFALQTQAGAADNAAANSHKITDYLKSGSTTTDSAQSIIMTPSYIGYRAVWETDPNTSAPWTPAAVNSLEAGVKLAV